MIVQEFREVCSLKQAKVEKNRDSGDNFLRGNKRQMEEKKIIYFSKNVSVFVIWINFKGIYCIFFNCYKTK